MLPPLRVRTYSLSMTPSFKPLHCSLTFSVVRGPAWSGSGQYLGVGSNYLASLTPGSSLYISPRPAKDSFHLPRDLSSKPIIMISAGSGLAPFYSFIQERMVWQQQGKPLATALLFFGCRGPHMDDLYYQELCEYEAAGVVSIYRAYSRDPEHILANGCRYVSHRVVAETATIRNLWDQNATVYVCGSGDMAKGVRTALEDALGALSEDRYITEIF